MDKERFITNFVEAIEGLEPEGVGSDTVMQDLPQWDSLAVLTTLAMVDAEYAVTITANELANCPTVGDLFQLVQERKARS